MICHRPQLIKLVYSSILFCAPCLNSSCRIGNQPWELQFILSVIRQTFGLTRMQLLKIIPVILSVLMVVVLSRALATGIYVRPLFFDLLSKILIQQIENSFSTRIFVLSFDFTDLCIFRVKRTGQSCQPRWTQPWCKLCQLHRRKILLLEHHGSSRRLRW